MPRSHTQHTRRLERGWFFRARSLSFATCLLMMPACVTTVEGPPRRGVPLKPVADSRTGTNVAAPDQTPVAMPDGPVAERPAETTTRAARTTVAILEVGLIPSDGQVLPLVSPDGRFIAVQHGVPPSWNVILGAGPQSPALSTRLAAYSIDEGSRPASQKSGQLTMLTPIAWAGDLPPGSVLGRSCNDSGFLIESPQPTGERWIGMVEWVSGRVRWLVRDDAVNSGASLGPAGELAYSKRLVGDDRRMVVMRKADNIASGQDEIYLDEPGVSFSFPSFGDEPGVVFVFASSANSLDLRAYRIPQMSGAQTATFLGSRQLLTRPDEAAAYVASSTNRVPALSPNAAIAGFQAFSGVFIYFHPAQGRMYTFDYRTGANRPLAAGSVSALAIDPQGSTGQVKEAFVFANDKSVRYAEFSDPIRRGKQESELEGVKLISGSLLPRQTTNTQWPFVLIGPGSEGTYRIFKMRFGDGK